MALEDLNLSDNLFTSQLTTISATFKYLGSAPNLKRLNLARNKLAQFHSDLVNFQTDFVKLQDFDISFNLVEMEESLWHLTLTKSLNMVVITGNPLALKSNK